MRIAILGSDGLLGSQFTLSECIRIQHKYFEITDRDCILSLMALRPDVIVNCAGIVRSRITSFQPSTVISVNSLAPHIVAQEAEFRSIPFIQISTDCVFNGMGNAPYYETAQPTPEDFYAQTKLVGEINRPLHTTIRTSFIGPYGGLLKWAYDKHVVTGYDEEYWNGLSAKTVANWIIDYIHSGMSHRLIHLHGQVYSKYDILKIASRVYGWSLDLKKGPTPAKHCKYRVLASSYIESVAIPINEQLEAMKND